LLTSSIKYPSVNVTTTDETIINFTFRLGHNFPNLSFRFNGRAPE